MPTTPRFKSPLIVADPGGFPYVLYRPLTYACALLARDIVVPKDFKTDFASIPRVMWRVLPKSGKYDSAGVIHDFLYYTGEVSRKEADQVLVEAAAASGVSAATCKLIYAGVRLGGWKPWRTYRNAPPLDAAAE